MISGFPGEGTLWIFHPGLGDKGLGIRLVSDELQIEAATSAVAVARPEVEM